MVKASLGKEQDTVSKITRDKGPENMPQEVEHLSKKLETLSSNPRTHQRNPNQNKKQQKTPSRSVLSGLLVIVCP
jgi:hypothetical protein